jgi:hypothetical protein
MNQHLVGQDIMNELESMIVEHKSNTPKRDNTTLSCLLHNIILPEHMSSPPVFSGIRVTRSLMLGAYFVDRLSFCPISFGHLVVCSS